MDKNAWSIAEARLHLSDVIKRAQLSPQILENRGKPVGALIDFQTLGRLQVQSPSTKGSRLLEKLATIIEQGGEDVSLDAPLKSLPRDPFDSEDR